MIPKIIHYCWFGRNPLPESAQKCIASWRKFLPDYEIWQWSEEPLNENEYENENLNVNKLADKVLAFDVNSIRYTQQAYEAKKYAFVSDYARFWILYHYGGLYFDTDVEVIKTMDDIVSRGAFMGMEEGASYQGKPMVAPGLGMGCEAGHPFYQVMLQHYASSAFLMENDTLNTTTIVEYTTRKLYEEGMTPESMLQEVNGIWIYPAEVFCPMDSTTGIIRVTANTVTIHHYDCSWIDHHTLRFQLHLLKNKINQFLYKIHIK